MAAVEVATIICGGCIRTNGAESCGDGVRYLGAILEKSGDPGSL